MRLVLIFALMLAAGVASANNKVNPPHDGTDDPDQGIGNDLGSKGSQNDLGGGSDASDSCAAPDPALNGGGAGTLAPPSDRSDNYGFSAVAGETYSIQMTVTGGDIGAHMTLWSPGCATLVAEGSPPEAGGATEVIVFTAGETGEYTLRLENVGGGEKVTFPRDGCGVECDSVSTSSNGDPSIQSGHCYPACRVSYTLASDSRDDVVT